MLKIPAVITVILIVTYASWFTPTVNGRSLVNHNENVDGFIGYFEGETLKFRRSLSENNIPIVLNADNVDNLDTESKYRLIEQTLTMLDQLIKSLENLGRKTREEKTRPKMTVGSGLMQQLDNLERMMRKERMSRRLDHLEDVRKKLLDLG